MASLCSSYSVFNEQDIRTPLSFSDRKCHYVVLASWSSIQQVLYVAYLVSRFCRYATSFYCPTSNLNTKQRIFRHVSGHFNVRYSLMQGIMQFMRSQYQKQRYYTLRSLGQVCLSKHMPQLYSIRGDALLHVILLHLNCCITFARWVTWMYLMKIQFEKLLEN